MSDIINIETKTNSAAHKVCHVAYTLNNEQPVISTIIGDQPLFYMDYECDYEDEGTFDAAEIGILESEVLGMQKEIKSLEKFSKDFVQAPDIATREFIENRESFTACANAQPASLEELTEILSKSRLAEGYLALAKEHNIEIKLTGQVPEGHYDRRCGTVFVNANLDKTDQILVCARELRRHWQHRQGALIQPLLFHPDSAILVNRVQSADLAVSMVRIAWELQLAEYKGAWERVENSSMEDLGRAFAREAFLDFRTINNGQAMAAAFEAWFLSERCRGEDRILIQNMLADYQGYVFDLEEAEKSITPALIAALGTMPFGKNYLSAHVATLTNDPIFTDVRDRSNANFLWFIKFERSFRETEQELHLNPDHIADDIAQAAFLKENQDLNNAAGIQNAKYEESAEIVELFASEEQSSGTRRLSSKSTKPAKGEGAEIIYLR